MTTTLRTIGLSRTQQITLFNAKYSRPDDISTGSMTFDSADAPAVISALVKAKAFVDAWEIEAGEAAANIGMRTTVHVQALSMHRDLDQIRDRVLDHPETLQPTERPTDDNLLISWEDLRSAGFDLRTASHDGTQFTLYNTMAGAATTYVSISVDPDSAGWVLRFSSRAKTPVTLNSGWSLDDEIHYALADKAAMLAKALWWIQ